MEGPYISILVDPLGNPWNNSFNNMFTSNPFSQTRGWWTRSCQHSTKFWIIPTAPVCFVPCWDGIMSKAMESVFVGVALIALSHPKRNTLIFQRHYVPPLKTKPKKDLSTQKNRPKKSYQPSNHPTMQPSNHPTIHHPPSTIQPSICEPNLPPACTYLSNKTTIDHQSS